MMKFNGLLAILLVATLAACSADTDGGITSAKAEAPARQSSLLVTPEDTLTLTRATSAAGPLITGSVQPERLADLRAEVSAVVMEVMKQNGDPVKAGDLLVRLDNTAIRDSLTSAEASARSAGQAYSQAERQFQRMTKLQGEGLVAAQAVEDAEIRRNNSQSDLESAKSLAATARQQLQRTQVRAPFDGIVSDRKVSPGDTAQIGKELLKVIDPHSMRLVGMVSADEIGQVKSGQVVSFRVHGYGAQEFLGNVSRVNPSADPMTRQVELLVDFAKDTEQPALGGLYAEGRVHSHSGSELSLPAAAIVREGNRAFVWQVSGTTLRKVPVELGERNARTGEFILKSGLSEGDKLLRSPSPSLKTGQLVELARAPEIDGVRG
jgi:RND family efflux transporter MFP subunit